MHFFNKAMMGRGLRLVQGSAASQGSLSVPPGVFDVKFTGQGGAGTNTYNPGQAYIAPAAGGYWYRYQYAYGGSSASSFPSFNYGPDQLFAPSQLITGSGHVLNLISGTPSSPGATAVYRRDGAVNDHYYFEGALQYYQAPVAGQPYIAPYYTYTTGPSTTSSSAIQTSGSLAWNGNYGAGLPTPTSQTMFLNGQGGSISYNVAAGATLAYEYWE